MLTKIISGAQTGVDRAALDVAIDLGYETGGFCPRGRKCESGTIPDKYPMVETDSFDYRVRTHQNVLMADGTLILTDEGRLTGGTKLTFDLVLSLDKIRYAVFFRDFLLRDEWEVASDLAAIQARCWVAAHGVRVLNVAGPRESKCPGVYEKAAAFMRKVLAR